MFRCSNCLLGGLSIILITLYSFPVVSKTFLEHGIEASNESNIEYRFEFRRCMVQSCPWAIVACASTRVPYLGVMRNVHAVFACSATM